jgi:NADH-quinone oxidoreductase subunit C
MNYIIEVLTILQSNNGMPFNMLADMFAVDMLKKTNEFDIYYNLFNLALSKRMFVVTNIGRDETAIGISSVFLNAVWYQREIFDMFGIIFSDYTETKRILTGTSFDGFPLRK